MKIKSFLFATVFAAAILLSAGFASATDNSAQIAQIQAQINALLAQVAAMQAAGGTSTTWCHTFNTNLGYAQSGSSEVVYLHMALQKEGFSYGTDGSSTYAEGTALAVAQFQERYASTVLAPSGLTKGTGYVGAATRTKLNALYGCSSTTTTTTTNTNTYYTLYYAAGTGGYISGTASQSVVSGGSGSTVTAVANSGYTFSTWSDGNTSATRTDTYVYSNKSVTAYFTATATTNTSYYTLFYSAGTGGYISGTASQNVISGGSGTTVTAIANSGYTFSSWSDGVTTASRTDTYVYSNKTLTAYFTAGTSAYTLNYVAGTGGYISGTATQSVSYGGSGTTVTAIANSGYTFSSWSDGITTATRTDTYIYSSKYVTAYFTASNSSSTYYTLYYAAGTGGYISGTASQSVVSGGSGSTVTAVANSGYTFSTWSDGNTSATRTDTYVYSNKSVTAYFTATATTNTSYYTLFYSAGTGGYISGTTTQSIVYGGSGTTVTAIPNSGYYFTSWSDGVTNATRTDTNVYSNQTLTANFAANSTSYYTLNYYAGTGGYISGTATQSITSGGSGTTVTAIANSGYTFSSWSDGVTTASRTDTSIYTNKSVTASFTANTVYYTLRYTKGTGGTLSGVVTQSVAYGGSGTEVTAVANSGYTFSRWSDGNTSATRIDENITADRAYVAYFTINTYALNYYAGTGGTITGTTPQSVTSGSSGTAVTAVANSGYYFTSWSDGVTTAARTDTNVYSNISVTASFSPDIVINAPAESSTLTIGQASLVSWRANSNISNVTISIYNVTSGATYAIATVPASTGYYYWLAGTAQNCVILPVGTQYKIVVSNASNPLTTASSGFIALVQPTLTSGGSATLSLVSPLGGESWQKGTTHWIQWASTGLPITENLTLSLLKTSTSMTRIAGTTNLGLYCWTIPSTVVAGQWKIFLSTGANASAIATYTSPFFNITD